MKKVLFLIGCFFVITIAHAQHETLFSKARVLGGFGGPLLEFGNIKGDYVTSVGGGGGIIIDNFFIGAYGLGSLDHLHYNINSNDDFQ